MHETKTCTQCGEIKPLEQFRKYYKGKGYYSYCKDCEKINTRAKYLGNKDCRTKQEEEEFTKINELYTLQRSLGLKPPTFKAHKWGAVTSTLDDMLAKYSAKHLETQRAVAGLVPEGTVVPYELSKWLTEPLTKDPDYYDDIYDGLIKIYRPLLHVHNETFEPEYDMTYSKVLEQILTRFTDYGDNYVYE